MFFDNTFKNNIYAISLGPIPHIIPFVTDQHTKTNLIASYLKRLTPLMPHTQPLRINNLNNFVNKFLKDNFKPLPPLFHDFKALVDEWLDDNSHYTLARKKQLRTAAMKILEYQTNHFNLQEKDYFMKSFIKTEFYPEDKYARYINSRSDKFKACVGPYIHLIEKEMYKLKYFIKHENIMDLPKKLIKLNKFKWILETDYTSFESGFSPEYTDAVECNLWRYFLQNNPEVLKIILNSYRIVKNNRAYPRISILQNKQYTAKVVGTRMSGEMWTSLANGFSNLMNMLFLAEQNGLTVDGFVEGDDGIFGMDQPIITENMFQSLGFKIRMKYGQDLSHTSFCGNIFDTKNLLYLVDLEQINRTFWTCTKKYFNAKPKILKMLLRAKAQSLYCNAKYTPIGGILAYRLIELLGEGPIILEQHNSWWEEKLVRRFSRETFEFILPKMDSRLLFSNIYGISIQQQINIENYIMNCKSIIELSTILPLGQISNLKNIRLH